MMQEVGRTTFESDNASANRVFFRLPSAAEESERGLMFVPGTKRQTVPEGHRFDARRERIERLFSAKRQFPTGYVVTKRAMDFIFGLAMLIALTPLLLAIAIILRVTGSQAIFSQQRVGKGGQMFACYKFRTMKPDAEGELARLLASSPELRRQWLSDYKLENDPRITRFGRFLRVTSLDELPQFINVLRGEMSLVGPRPIVPDELAKYGPYADHYLSVKPGLTGLWQISGRNNLSYHRRVALDVAYARNASFRFDLNILLRSTVPILSGRGAK